MRARRILMLLSFVGALVGVAAVSFFGGDAFAVGTFSVRQVTPDQLGLAMKADDFYSEFREDTLVVRGTVASVSRAASGMNVAFQTQNGIETLCAVGLYSSAIHVGERVTVVTEGANAQRLSSGVLLSNCVVAAP
jgi:hypothetical protein